jgi:hypothetical protein
MAAASVVLNEEARFWNRGFYAVAAGPLPSEATGPAVMKEACEAIAKSLDATVTSETPIELGGYKGHACDLRASGAAGQIRARVVATKDHLYIAYVGGKDEAGTEAAHQFLESIRIAPAGE